MKLDKVLDIPFLGETTFTFHVRYVRGHPGRYTMPNGDPGYPPDGDELYIDKVTFGQLDVSELFENPADDLYDELLELAAEQSYEDRVCAEEERYADLRETNALLNTPWDFNDRKEPK